MIYSSMEGNHMVMYCVFGIIAVLALPLMLIIGVRRYKTKKQLTDQAREDRLAIRQGFGHHVQSRT